MVTALRAEGVDVDQPGSTRPLGDHPLFDAPNPAFTILPEGWPRYRPGQFPVADALHRHTLKLPVPHDDDALDGIEQQVVGAVIDYQGTILLLKRPADDFRGGTWELPSGKVEPRDADLYAALHREIGEETGLIIWEINGYLGAFDYTSGSGKHTRQHTGPSPSEASCPRWTSCSPNTTRKPR